MGLSTEMTTVLPNSPPDRSDPQAVDLHCPLCGYDLRGLADGRCPECGFAFRRAELLDAERDRHPWLFEHAPRGRLVRSFFSTYGRAAFPRRFWRQVTPANTVRPRRLAAYWLVASLPLVAVVAAPVPGQVVRLAQRNTLVRAQYARQLAAMGLGKGSPPGPMAVFRAQFDARYPVPWSPAFARQVVAMVDLDVAPDRAAAAVVAATWPWLSLAALMLFQMSMRRAKVSPAHVLRAAVYGCDFGLMICITAAVVFSPAEVGYPRLLRGPFLGSQLPSGPFPPRDMPLLLVLATCGLVATYRLAVAYRLYLRFDRPLLTVAASQVIVLLLVLLALLWTVKLF